jgi:hypothetical protein
MFAKSQTHPPTSQLFFLGIFLLRFRAFLGTCKESSKIRNTTTIFLQKVHVEGFSKQIDKNFDVSFSAAFFVPSRFRVSQRWEFKSTTKNVLQK